MESVSGARSARVPNLHLRSATGGLQFDQIQVSICLLDPNRSMGSAYSQERERLETVGKRYEW